MPIRGSTIKLLVQKNWESKRKENDIEDKVTTRSG
jgi:hypothetical protein